jgi:hypothetical protein
MDVYLLWVLCVVSRGLCDELITRPEESYRLWCVVVCDLEISRIRRPWPALDRSATIYIYIATQNSHTYFTSILFFTYPILILHSLSPDYNNQTIITNPTNSSRVPTPSRGIRYPEPNLQHTRTVFFNTYKIETTPRKSGRMESLLWDNQHFKRTQLRPILSVWHTESGPYEYSISRLDNIHMTTRKNRSHVSCRNDLSPVTFPTRKDHFRSDISAITMSLTSFDASFYLNFTI